MCLFVKMDSFVCDWFKYFPNQWQDIFGIFLGTLMFLLYVYVNKLVKMTGGIIRWKYEGGIYLPWFEIIWISIISNDSLTPYNIHLSVIKYMYIVQKCRNYAHLLSCELCVMHSYNSANFCSVTIKIYPIIVKC